MQPVSSASVAQLRQRPEVAIHAEHAVGDEQLALTGGQSVEDPACGADVLVRKDLDRRAAQAAAVDDAGVIELVGDDDVILGQDCRHRAGVRREAALKDDDGLDLLEFRQLPFELHVHRHRAGDGAHRAGADAELLDRFERLLPQPRVRREPEIVVRREIDDRAMVERGVGLLLVVEHAQVPIEVLLLERVELVAQKGKRVLTHRGSISFGSRLAGRGFAVRRAFEDCANVPKLDDHSQGSETASPRTANREPATYLGVSREPIHSVNARHARARPRERPPRRPLAAGLSQDARRAATSRPQPREKGPARLALRSAREPPIAFTGAFPRETLARLRASVRRHALPCCVLMRGGPPTPHAVLPRRGARSQST